MDVQLVFLLNDRAKTIKSLVDPNTKPHNLGRPGHIFPLKAKNGGVLRRTGHTEAAVDLARLAGFKPAGILVEILNEDGTMARLPELIKVAEKFNLKIISIDDLVSYRMENDSLIIKNDFKIETRFGVYRLRAYQQTTNNAIHIALTKGEWGKDQIIPTRINSTAVNNDILGTLTNNSDKKLDEMFKVIDKERKGAIIFINQYTSPEKTLKRLNNLEEIQNLERLQRHQVLKWILKILV